MSGPGAPGPEGLSRFLLRSEAIASSQIEGLQVSAQQIAMAELSQTEDDTIRGFSDNARLVANNITALRTAWTDLAAQPEVTPSATEDLHAALLPGHQPAGLREVQNWIGGSGWHPLDDDFVPPPAEHVKPLMRDLTDYPTVPRTPLSSKPRSSTPSSRRSTRSPTATAASAASSCTPCWPVAA